VIQPPASAICSRSRPFFTRTTQTVITYSS